MERKRKTTGPDARATGTPAALAPTLASNRALFAMALIAAALAFAIYFQGLGHPFVYDDHRMVVDNPSIRELSNWRWVLTYEPFRPLLNLSFAVDFQRAALAPAAFHATNLALHALCTVLFFFVVRSALQDARRATPPVSELPAFVAAALFAVHPLQIEVAHYVAGRSESLCGAFVLAAWLAWRRWALDGDRRWLAGGAALWLFALASKEVAAALPPLFAIYDVLLLDSEGSRRRLRRFHLPLLALLAVGAIVRLWSYVQVEVDLPRPIWQNAATQWVVIWKYLGLLVVPRGQSLIHSVEPAASLFEPRILLAGLALLGLCAAAWAVPRTLPLASVAIAWFLLFLAPSSSLIPLHELMAEHRVYLASGGLFLGAAVLLERLAARKGAGSGSTVVAIAGGIPVVILAMTTLVRLAAWSDPVVLWRDAMTKAPGEWRAQAGYGGVLRESGRCDEAVPLLEHVVAALPADLNAWMDLGICRAQIGRPVDARAAFQKALEIDPKFVRAHNNLGRLAFLEGQISEARKQFATVLAQDPRNVTARQNLIHIERVTTGNQAEIERLCRELSALSGEAARTAGCAP